MTTIACDRRSMAADKRVTAMTHGGKSVTTFPCAKIEQIGDSLYGCAGDFQAAVRFIEWLRRGKGRAPRLCKDFAALKLSPAGIFVIDADDPTWMRCDNPHFAIGSGAPYALGAMDHGASPAQAVETAKKWDIYSGGEVTALTLEEHATAGR